MHPPSKSFLMSGLLLVLLLLLTIHVQAAQQPEAWFPTTTEGAPSARNNHTAVWAGAEVIIWGGYGATFDVNSGGRYDPEADAWLPTSTTGAPDPRERHSAVWSGTEMIVWGGSRFGSYYDTGGRYNPVQDRWSATSIINAPSPRRHHTAVWTGSEMIVWGGFCCDSNSIVVNTGGRYDPILNEWRPIATTNAPPPAAHHTAVWTGTEMLVWGGTNGTSPMNMGGRYDPVSDTWAPISTVDSPSPRAVHAAVWTGSEMIVWGGEGPTGPLDTGARYDPVHDTWAPITLAGAPSPRSHMYTAVWTGSEMIVWGGAAGAGVFLNTGDRYDPATNRWIATTLSNAPSPRHALMPVWTGREMVVWGGGDASGYLGTGGRYLPGSSFRLLFPLPNWTPYTVPVSALLDHSIECGYNCFDKHVRADSCNAPPRETTCGPLSDCSTPTVPRPRCYMGGNGVVRTFTGQEGRSDFLLEGECKEQCVPSAAANCEGLFTACAYPNGPLGSRTTFESSDLGGINYVGTGNLLFLQYDGHSGYDYAVARCTQIVAPADGTLVRVPSGGDKVNGREKASNTFKIIHGAIGGTVYETWYLHTEPNSEDPASVCGIVSLPEGQVIKGQAIAVVGCAGLPDCDEGKNVHLHLEVRTYPADGDPVRDSAVMDPYAEGYWD